MLGLEFFEGDGEVVGADFGDFVVGVVCVFCEIVSEDFGFDEIFEALREVDRERKFNMIVHVQASVLAGRLNSADEVASVAFPLQLFGESFVEREFFGIFDFFHVYLVGNDLLVEAIELVAVIGELGQRLADFDLFLGVGLLHPEGEGVGDDFGFRRRDDALAAEHGGMGDAAGDILTEQAPVEGKGRVEIVGGFI